MKTVVVAAIFIAMLSLCAVRPKLYSREQEEQRIADSLIVADSLRVVDSIRIADSCMITRYKQADTVRKKEVQQKTDSVYSAMFIFEETEPAVEYVTDDADAVSARSVVIDPDSPQARVIDSLQALYSRKNDLLHDGDTHFKTMKTFAVSEKKRYMRFLLDNKMKDTAQIAAYCDSLNGLYKLRLEFFLAIQESQKGNTKSFVRLHIEEHMRKMEELGAFIFALTPEVPFYPERAYVEQ